LKEGDAFTVKQTVQQIIEKVRLRKDKALFAYSKKFDGIALATLKVSKKRLSTAAKKLSKKEKRALLSAASNIRAFAKRQLPCSWKKESKGVLLGELVVPIETVGVYVPAGNFPLISSLLMTVIPAQVAGVKRIIVCTPPKASEKVFAAASLLGLKEIFLVGGAQAIAAMAFGTETIPKCDKIVGPGNSFVEEAKRQLYGIVDIDMPAGPSEVIVFSNKGKAGWIAAELKAQAEHAADARALFLTCNKALEKKIKGLCSEIKNIEIVSVSSETQAISFINNFAPEHLVLFDGESLLKKIKNAGSVFLGKYSAVAFGDYCSGSNHVLPTAGFAKARAGLSAKDFVKCIAFQQVSKRGAENLAKTGEIIAWIEGLKEHKKSMEFRRQSL
jgi:histidinol dehydrogenase